MRNYSLPECILTGLILSVFGVASTLAIITTDTKILDGKDIKLQASFAYDNHLYQIKLVK